MPIIENPVIPYADWHGAMEDATTPTGMQIPCKTTPNLCRPGIWPASNLGAFFEPSAPADHQAWFGSLTTGKTDASGFMYMRNRYYNPQTGTFTQPDPIGIAGGLNVYGFAAGDPVTYSDPYGLMAEDCCCDVATTPVSRNFVKKLPGRGSELPSFVVVLDVYEEVLTPISKGPPRPLKAPAPVCETLGNLVVMTLIGVGRVAELVKH